MTEKKIWLTWEKQRRNTSMSKALDAELFELLTERTGVLRYLELAFKTVKVITARRPDVVFAQNPSIVLSFIVVILNRVFGYVAVIDEHNSGLFPLEGRNKLLNRVARFIVRKSAYVIVSNERLGEVAQSWGGTAMVVPDPIPDFGPYFNSIADNGNIGFGTRPFRIFCICTWAEDEPVEEVIEAAKNFSEKDLLVEITGKPKKNLNEGALPPQVKLLGYIPEDDYLQKLAASDAVIVLTKRDDCLNCGAYEAVALKKPGLLSDKAALRRHFSKGFIFVDNTVPGIQEGLNRLLAEYSDLKKDTDAIKQELTTQTDNRLGALKQQLL